ncbi:16S rRNA methyltransferase [Actibacterium mucosum KCTC 23349]|uniref:16S rRNA methyltransferase n=1 Tax=Actibacterium mucosum KCTC 23349 TaxID=1454373 RepID=A0A037ZPQ9_9RHOB|nr:transcription antitermination factor NusB [Actibacterium mucosum]KAJ57523.1 16S rRNA methyltransferase [Actibacterium mucosum KCTC 23349]
MALTTDPARAAAAQMVHDVLIEKLQLSDSRADEGLAPEDRARALRLTLATLRNLDRADTVLKPLLRKHPPVEVRNLLRQGVAEIHAEGAPAHGVVNDIVTLFRARPATGSFAGLGNAVLRKAAEAEEWDTLPPQKMAGWLRGRVEGQLGRKTVLAIEAAHDAGAPVDLTPADGDAVKLAAATGGTALPTGSVRLDGRVQVSALPGYEDGTWWVQDAAAALPAKLLNAQAGQRVLDLCAAPGGKTMQLAASGADVTALDISKHRLGRLRDNLRRTDLTAEIVVADALTWQPDAPFEAILLDAPCSATGTIRRHPDLPHVRDGKDVKALVSLQSALLDRALTMLVPGGTLIYCTCSLLPDEGEAQVTAALERHDNLQLAPLAAPWIEGDWHSAEGGLRLRPDFWADRGGMDGFYIAKLHKSA